MDPLADTLLMRILDHERSLQAQKAMEEREVMRQLNRQEEQAWTRDREDFDRNFKMAQLEGQMAKTLGRPAPEYSDQRMQRSAMLGSSQAEMQELALQRAAAQMVQKQRFEMEKSRQPERTEQMRKNLGHISYLGHRPPSGSGSGANPMEDFLNQVTKIQGGYNKLRASLPEQLVMPGQAKQHEEAGQVIEKLNELMLLVRSGAMPVQQAYQVMQKLPRFGEAMEASDTFDKESVEAVSTMEPEEKEKGILQKARQWMSGGSSNPQAPSQDDPSTWANEYIQGGSRR